MHFTQHYPKPNLADMKEVHSCFLPKQKYGAKRLSLSAHVESTLYIISPFHSAETDERITVHMSRSGADLTVEEKVNNSGAQSPFELQLVQAQNHSFESPHQKPSTEDSCILVTLPPNAIVTHLIFDSSNSVLLDIGAPVKSADIHLTGYSAIMAPLVDARPIIREARMHVDFEAGVLGVIQGCKTLYLHNGVGCETCLDINLTQGFNVWTRGASSCLTTRGDVENYYIRGPHEKNLDDPRAPIRQGREVIHIGPIRGINPAHQGLCEFIHAP